MRFIKHAIFAFIWIAGVEAPLGREQLYLQGKGILKNSGGAYQFEEEDDDYGNECLVYTRSDSRKKYQINEVFAKKLTDLLRGPSSPKPQPVYLISADKKTFVKIYLEDRNGKCLVEDPSELPCAKDPKAIAILDQMEAEDLAKTEQDIANKGKKKKKKPR